MSPVDGIDAVVARHARGVWRYLRSLGCQADAADDLTQESFVIALRRGVEGRTDGERAEFLRRTARHLWLRQRQKDRRRAELLADAVDELWQRHCGDDGGEALIDALRACVSDLRGRARRAIALVYGDGLGRADAAAQLGMKTTGVKSLLQRVKVVLRECVERRSR